MSSPQTDEDEVEEVEFVSVSDVCTLCIQQINMFHTLSDVFAFFLFADTDWTDCAITSCSN